MFGVGRFPRMQCNCTTLSFSQNRHLNRCLLAREMLHELVNLWEKTSELLFNTESVKQIAKRDLFLFLPSECFGHLSGDDAFLRQRRENVQTSLEDAIFLMFGLSFAKGMWSNADLLTTAYLIISRWFHFWGCQMWKGRHGLIIMYWKFPRLIPLP